MKKIFLLLTLVLAVSCTAEVSENDVINVVPYPNEVQLRDGVFNAKGAAVTYAAAMDEASVALVKAFAEKLSQISGAESTALEGDAEKGFVFVYNELVPEEAYELDVRPEMVLVQASGLRGFNYALQTIRQLLPVEIFGSKPAPRAQWTIQCVYVNDAPRFAYRGLHLDEGRHFFGVDEVKRYLDIMEVHKLNKFHWHLTEDQGWRIEIKKYPLLTEIGAVRKGTCIKKDFANTDGVPYGEGLWYTQDQIREIVAYAASKGIDVIPEIDLPGHMLAALTAYPELGCTGGPYEVWTRWGVSEDVLCAGNEKVYTFLEDVLAEVCDMFPYEYVHIGGDECPKVRWENCPKCQAMIKKLGLKDENGHNAEHYLQSHVMARMETFLASKGRKVIGWDEILEGEIGPDATVMSWRGEAGGLEAARLGHDAVMTPNTYYYLDYYQSLDVANEPFGIGGYLPVEKCYSYEPYVEGMTDEEKSHIIGVQANLWTEYIATADHLHYMLLPRLAALAEVQWCNESRKDWNRFENAADDFCAIYETMGYNYATHIFQVKGKITTDPFAKSVIVELDAQGDAPVRYTLNGRTPGRFSPQYKEPLVITESCELNAAVIRKGLEPRIFNRKFDFHKAVGHEVTYSPEPHRGYRSGAPGCLVDGLRGAEQFKSAEWVAWYSKPFDVVIDMEGSMPYSSVILGTLVDKGSYIFNPLKLSASLSEDGVDYTEVAVAEYDVMGQDDPDGIMDYTLSFPQTQARYLKLSCTPLEFLPQWHYAAGRRAFVFVDEIVVK